jgi:hypothetical protein
MPLGPQLKTASIKLFGMQSDDVAPAWCRQGYLLVSIGDKVPGPRS